MMLGITLGDVGGVGPEIILKTVYTRRWPAKTRFVIIGSRSAVRKQAALLEMPAPDDWTPGDGTVSPERVSVWQPESGCGTPELCPGRMKKSSGAAAAEWVRAGVNACMDGVLDGLVTAPVCKETFSGLPRRGAAGCSGHTEYIARLTGARRPAMMLMGGGLRVVLATAHLPLSKVARAVTQESVVDICLKAAKAMQWLGLDGRLALCGLNPHAGENGALGAEESAVLRPALKKLKQHGLNIEGPVPADTVFYHARKGRYDAVIAMYHDQGLAPLKTVAFETGVNVTLGIPIVRTSPDHGTAFDIAGRGLADPESMVRAVKCAGFLAKHSNPWRER